MPRYYINGKWYRSDSPLTDDELEELGGTAPEQGPGAVESAIKWANTPLWQGPSQFGRYVSGSDTRQANFGDDFGSQLYQGITEHPWETAKGFVQGGIEGLGNFASGLTTPLNLATLGAARGATSAAARGLPAATQAFTWAGRALGAPQAYEGYQTMTDPNLPTSSRVMGGIQAAGGIGQMFTGAPQVRDPYRRGPIDPHFEMEDLGPPPSPPPATEPPVRQPQRTFNPNFTPRALIPDITETFPYEEYTTPAPPPPTDPRMSSIAERPGREFAVDESGRHLGGYIGDDQTPFIQPDAGIQPSAPPMGQSAAEIELANIRAEVEALKAKMRAAEDEALGVTPEEAAGMRGGGMAAIQQQMAPEQPAPIQQPQVAQGEIMPPEPNPFQIEQRPQSTQLAGPQPVWPPTAPAQPIWPTPAGQQFPAFPGESAPPATQPPTAPPQAPTVPPTGPPANSAQAIVDKIKKISKKKAAPPVTPPPMGTVPVPQQPAPLTPPIQRPPAPQPENPFTPSPEPQAPTLPPAPAGFADQVVPPTVNEALQQAPPTEPPKKAGGLRPRQKFTQPPKPYVAPPEPPIVPQAGEPVIARSADQVHQLLSEGYKVISQTTDGGIVMEPPPAQPTPPSGAGAPSKPRLVPKPEATTAQSKAAEFAEVVRQRKFNYGVARAKAKELGIKVDREAKLFDIYKAIKEKDPGWEPPSGSTVNEPPSVGHERMPGAGGGGGRGNVPPRPPGGLGPASPPPPNNAGGNVPPNQPPPPNTSGTNRTPFNQPPRRPGARVIRRPEPQPWYREIYNLSRGLMSVDPPFISSAAFRQGLPWIGTKHWLGAWKAAFKSYGSERAYSALKTAIETDPLFRVEPRFRGAGSHVDIYNSIASEMGLKLGDLTDEILTTSWAEKIPGWGRHVAGSNRAYNAFLNHLRAYTYKRLLTDAGIWDGRNVTNIPLAKELADFVNTTTGRGKLQFSVGISPTRSKTLDLESSAKILTDTMFSPRLIASRIKMLNPSTYLMATPAVRQQYLKAMARTVGAWWTIASMLELAGGDVSKDPTNADYGKIRFGDTRIDPGGGFQQFLVAFARMTPEGMQPPPETGFTPADLALGFAGGGGGTTSSVSGQFNRFGEGYKPETRLSTLGRFAVSKLHPTLKLAIDILNASQREPVYLGDRLLQMAAPIMLGDMIKIAQEDPALFPLVGASTGIGMGGQTYEGGIPEPQLMPEALQDYDIVFGGEQ